MYDRHWPTAGGGEKFAGALAQVLRESHDVTLLAHDPLDLDQLGERLSLDLAGIPVERIGLAGRVTEASARYDLLVNASFESWDRNGARSGIYVVHFPQDPWTSLAPKQRRLVRALGPRLGQAEPVWEPGAGLHRPDPLRASQIWWTDGDGELAVRVPAGRPRRLHLLFANLMPPGADARATIEVEGQGMASVVVGSPGSIRSRLAPSVASFEVVGKSDGSPVRLKVRSDVHRSSLADDPRELGVPLMGVAVGGSPLGWLRAYASVLRTRAPSADFVDSYDLVLSNSEFTRRWVGSYWGASSEVLHPPVTMRAADRSKEPIVLSIGRFFPPERGHSKKQLELVEAFGRLVRSGGAGGWELHLVGGCAPADEPYLRAVRSAAQGLPVSIHVDASGEDVASLYERASIYWHAAGYAEDVDVHPDRMEHFGITTVEAMSAGVVPVAYGEAGPLEAFDDGVEGFHFHSLDRLVESTRLLVAEPARLEEMARAATRRAQHFSMERFSQRVFGYVDTVVNGPEHGR